MKIIANIWKSIANEFILIFLLIFILNTIIGKQDIKINGDGKGYYDYLPSLFIHHDFTRNDLLVSVDSLSYKRINSVGIYNDFENRKLNKYSCGTAIFQFPFFITTYFLTERDGTLDDGYQKYFQKSIYYAALFYLFLGLVFFKKILKLYFIPEYIIKLSQLFIVFSTSIIHYTNIDPAYSHIYSFFALTSFIYLVKKYFENQQIKYFIYACVVLGFIFILRQINVLIILFIPFLATYFETFKQGVITIFKHPKHLILGVFMFISIVSIQCLVWYLQVGKWVVYSYQKEGFNFLSPEFFNILFSYQKGLFLYAPILLIATLTSFLFLYQKKYYLLYTWLGFFILLTYFLSSWWCWYYGASFGQRPFIEFYAIFFIPFAVFLQQLSNFRQIVFISLSTLTIPLSLIQSYQYKEFILHWVLMDKGKYWDIFLKTDDKYKGFVWKNKIDSTNYTELKKIKLGDFCGGKKNTINLLTASTSSIQNFNNVTFLQLSFENEFKETDDAKIKVSIIENGTFYNYCYEINLIQFTENKFNILHKGIFNFEIKPTIVTANQVVKIELITQHGVIKLKNVQLKFLAPSKFSLQ